MKRHPEGGRLWGGLTCELGHILTQTEKSSGLALHGGFENSYRACANIDNSEKKIGFLQFTGLNLPNSEGLRLS